MIRRWAVVLAAGAAVLALAVPAQAKGEASKVSITNAGGPGGSGSGGPGGSGKSSGGSGTGSAAVLASPIVLSGPEAGSWLGESGFFEATPGRPHVASFGPSLDVVVSWSCGGPGTPGGTVRQQLFPYASGGALIHSLPGQKFCEGTAGGGWWTLANGMLLTLERHGLPETLPVTKHEAPAGRPAKGPEAGSAAARTETSPGTAPWILPVALGAAAIMIVAGSNVAIRRRRRETARPA